MQITTPNFLAAYGQGVQLREAEQAIGNRNALTSALQAGDMGAARNAFAAVNPEAAYTAMQPAKRDPKETMQIAGKLTRAVLSAPPEMRNDVYAEALSMAGGMGLDISGLPEAYDEQSVMVMDRLFNMQDDERTALQRELEMLPEAAREDALMVHFGLRPKAQAPKEPAGPSSGIGKLTEDYRNGFISEEDFNAGRAKLSGGQQFSVTTTDGTTVTYGQGAAAPKLTEQQSKDLVYFERASGAAPTIEKFERELTNWVDNRAEKLPFGFGNYLVSDEFQQGRQAAAEWLAAILRKDTGAAITNQEFELYGPMYLPLPGDGDAVLRQKRTARARAVDAIKRGLGPAQVLTSEYQARGMGLESLTDEQLDELIRLQGGQ